MIANIFGLGWAATPAGLKAMEQLENLEEERRAREGSPGRALPAGGKQVCPRQKTKGKILQGGSKRRCEQ